MKLTVLAGGVGAARFLEGVVQVVPQEDITVISNIGEDEEFFGFHGIDMAAPAPGVLEAIAGADIVALAPSNPIVSIGPLLAVRGVREALRETPAKIVAVSPIIGGKTVKGPADRMMASLGMTPTAVGVAQVYADFLDVLVIDEEDAELAAAVEAAGVRAVVAQTIMHGAVEKRALTKVVIAAAAA